MVPRTREARISCIPEKLSEENKNTMAYTEAQLAGAKHLRSNTKFAITHHTRTMNSILSQERTTAAELEDLIIEFNIKANVRWLHSWQIIIFTLLLKSASNDII